MTAPLLHVRVALIDHSSHPLIAMLFAGDDCVSDTMHHRDMRAVRAYYNGMIRGLTLTNAIRYETTEVTLDRIGHWPYARVTCHIPINPEYMIAHGIDPMNDD
jgi:hypothetical protein